MTIGRNKNIAYEFYINTEYGESVWHWDLTDWRKALRDFIDHKDDEGFVFEIQITYEEGCDFVEIYPNNETEYLPKYVQKFIDKVLKGI
tara:strand:- start:10671 stop:10937 length:267 start_codon:yes stop_codon:yes gene_type:complete